NLLNNTIANNEIGVILGEYSAPVEYNNIYDNTIYNLKNTGAADKNISNNWWGTIDLDEISAKLFDGYDDSELGILYFEPILNEPDEGLQNMYFLDADGDGYGDGFVSVGACDTPVGYVADNTDCDDSDPYVNPGATEVCDGRDNNCNGTVDEGFDADDDGICDNGDNCPLEFNPSQNDIDGDGVGDLCDVCPADPIDGCNQDGSTAEEITPDEGGTVETPDGALTIEIEPGDLDEVTSISVTQTIPQDPEVDISVGPNPGLGQAVAVYDLEPEGLTFANPLILTIIVDVTALNANQRNHLNLYTLIDTDNDGVEDSFVPIDGTVSTVTEGPPGTFIAELIAELEHFSFYAVIVPLDKDNDGLFDFFPPVDEATYGTDPVKPDTDEDGLFDWTEVSIALGAGCPDPVNPDSDGDTLLDGYEIANGMSPCNSDTDSDQIPDNIDPFPTDPREINAYLEGKIRELADFIWNLDVVLFTGPNANANHGRRKALFNKANAAANTVSDGATTEALDILTNLKGFVDGIEPRPDWIKPSNEKNYIVSELDRLIELLEYLL
ncbi:MAG: putative metal-binding motif-containing protein, partial [Thermoplasmata archaeon]